jgi:hypothetical protein
LKCCGNVKVKASRHYHTARSDALMDKAYKGVETALKVGERQLGESGTQGSVKIVAALLRYAARMFG